MSDLRSIARFTVALAALAAHVAIAANPALTAAAAAAAGGAVVTTYPTPAIYNASATYALRANGKVVPVIEFAKQYDYAVFALNGVGGDGCKLEIARLDGKPIAKYEISPKKLSLAGAVSQSTLAFTIARPVYLIVAVDDLRKLVIAVDPAEQHKPASSGRGIYNVTAEPYHADASGAKPATNAIQRAVNEAGTDASGNGIVHVPAGVYLLSELRLVSNVTLYLEDGAVLRLSGKREDLKVRYHKRSQNRDGTWFIYTADGATNVKILGRGTIDGDGQRIEKDLQLTSHLVVPMNCTGFTMDGPVLRDSGLWGTVIANSEQVALRNTKHFNRLDMGEDDCVDVCNSQDVTVERSIAISLDDPYSTKTWAPETDLTRQWTGTFGPNRNIVFDDCLSWTRCFAFKIGAGVWRDQENITVRNAVVYDSAHAIGISHSYGSADVRNVAFDTIDVEHNTMTNLGRSWARFVIDPRKSDGGQGGGVYDLRVRQITVRDAGTEPIPVQGLSAHKMIRGLTFENIRMPGPAAPAGTLTEIGVTDTRFAEGVAVSNRVTDTSQSNEVEGRRQADAHPPLPSQRTRP